MENILQRILSVFQSKPNPEFIAQQLRKPSGPFAEKIAAKMDEVNAPAFDLTLETMQPDDKESILEIGFGSGTYFNKVCGSADELSISGIDYSSDMVEQARDTNPSLLESGKLDLKLANSTNIPYSDQSFDKVYCNMVIYFWDEPGQHLKEVKRVLKSDGKFYTGMRSKDSMLKLPFIEHGFNLYDTDQWCSLLTNNGFEVQNVKRSLDPAMEIEGREMQMESICVVAGKNSQ